MAQIDQEDEGFEALLKPIQDLTRNWDDLSLHLEEYMNYIRQICDENIPEMNFAQAAVLLQNSANIYCNKVDDLFTTVCQLVDSIRKKQYQIQSIDEPEENGGAEEQKARRKRKALAAALDTDQFLVLDEVCSDRNLTISLEKEKKKNRERKKPKIVLNAAIKVKSKEKTSCNVYIMNKHHAQDVMGKKEEFRLNWRICSAGTLHEEFVNCKTRFRVLEPVEVSVTTQDDDHSHLNGDVVPYFPDDDLLPSLAPSLFPEIPIYCENSLKQERIRVDPENLVNVKELEWQPNDFNDNIIEKPIKKRKVTKIPQGQEDEIPSYTVTDMFSQFHNVSFLRDLDFGFQLKTVMKKKKLMYLEHRSNYEGFVAKQAGQNQDDDFLGFRNDDHESDDDLDFAGFDDVHESAPELDAPLPEKENILDPLKRAGWTGDDMNTYDTEAIKAIPAYQSRKMGDKKRTDMANRVAEWHSRVIPKLEAAEERNSFDILAYGTQILNLFTDGIGSKKSFHEIVAGVQREEVARYFLASLMLANQNNVKITKSEPGDSEVDTMELTLLSKVRHHEELDDTIRQTSDKSI